MNSPDYSRIQVPVLAFFRLPKALEDQLRLYPPKNAEERTAIEQVYAADMDYVKRSIAKVRSGVPDARVIELVGASHYIFLSNEPDVLREIRAFLATLH
jgi:non-heme chloroperoxidase